MARFASRVGWATLAGIILTEVVGPMVLTGTPPPTGSTDRAVIGIYYETPGLAVLALAAMVPVLGFVVFVTALRTVAGGSEVARPWADTGLALAVVAAALLLVRGAIQLAAIRATAIGLDPVPLHLAWDFTYNTGVYAVEATYPLAIAVALRLGGFVPRWYVTLAAVTCGLQFVNMTSLVVGGIPTSAAMVGNIAFVAWFASTAWLVGRAETGFATTTAPATA